MNNTPNPAVPAAFFGLGLTFELFLIIACIVIVGYPLSVMAKRKGLENTWFSYVPILQQYEMLLIADLPTWYLILLFIPCINIFVHIYMWMKVAGAMGKEEWMGLLMLIPVANLIVPYYIAGIIGN